MTTLSLSIFIPIFDGPIQYPNHQAAGLPPDPASYSLAEWMVVLTFGISPTKATNRASSTRYVQYLVIFLHLAIL